MLPSIEKLLPIHRLVLFLQRIYIDNDFMSYDNKLFLDDCLLSDQMLHYSFSVDTKSDGQSIARANDGRDGGISTRVYSTAVRIGVQVGRALSETTERAFGGKPSGATRRGVLSEYSVMLCMAS